MRLFILFLLSLMSPLGIAAENKPQMERIAAFIGEKDEVISAATSDKWNRFLVAGKTYKLQDAKVNLRDGSTENMMSENDTNGHTGALFLAAFDTLGNLIWKVVSPSPKNMTNAHIWSIHCDAFGNVIIGGNFRHSLQLNATNGQSQMLHAYIRQGAQPYSLEGAPYNSFIAKYNADGELLWAQTGISHDHSAITQIVSDSNGNVFLLAYAHSNTFSLGQQVLLKNNGAQQGYVYNFDLLVIALNADGHDVWAFYGGGIKARELVFHKDKGLMIRCMGEQSEAKLWHSEGLFYTLQEYSLFEHIDLYLDADGTLRHILPAFKTQVRSRIHKIVESANETKFILTESYQYTPFHRTNFAPQIGKTHFAVDSGNFRLIALNHHDEVDWHMAFYSRHSANPGNISFDDYGNIYLSGLYMGFLHIAKDGKIIRTLSAPLPASFTVKISPTGELLWYHTNAYLDIRTYDGNTSYVVPAGNRLYMAATLNFDPESFEPASQDARAIRQTQYSNAYVTMSPLLPDRKPQSNHLDSTKDITPKDTFYTQRLFDSAKSLPAACSAGSPANQAFQLYPNPIQAGKVDVNVEIEIDQGGPVHLVVIDQNARLVYQQNNIIVNGKTHIIVKLDHVKSGLYYFRVSRENLCHTKKLVVM